MVRTVPGALAATIQPETDADRLMVSPRTAAEPSGAESRWESMIDFRETESSREAAPDVAPRRRVPWPLMVAAALFGVLLLGVIIYVATNNGRIMVVVNDPKAVVKIDSEEVRIEASARRLPSARRARAGGQAGRWRVPDPQVRRPPREERGLAG